MKHPEFEWLTGRLDGILEMNEETYDDTSRKRKRKETQCVLEIKCPLKTDRSEPLTENNDVIKINPIPVCE